MRARGAQVHKSSGQRAVGPPEEKVLGGQESEPRDTQAHEALMQPRDLRMGIHNFGNWMAMRDDICYQFHGWKAVPYSRATGSDISIYAICNPLWTSPIQVDYSLW